MIGTARAVIGTIALILVLGPAAVSGEVADGRQPRLPVAPGPVTWVGECELVTPVQDQAAKPRVRRGVLGWLYKYTRNIDVERAGTTRLPGFLRSPLLGALPGRPDVDCNDREAPLLDGAVSCAVISLNPGSEESVTFTAPMPQLGEATLAGIEDQIRERVSRGEKVALSTNKGGVVRIRPDAAGYVNARACRTDA